MEGGVPLHFLSNPWLRHAFGAAAAWDFKGSDLMCVTTGYVCRNMEAKRIAEENHTGLISGRLAGLPVNFYGFCTRVFCLGSFIYSELYLC